MATKAAKGTIVEEDRRLFLRKEMEDFRDSKTESLRFPANLSNVERKFIHKVAAELNLVSKSTGGGADRFITVWKRDSTTAPAKAQGLTNKLITWELSSSIRSALQSANLFSALDVINHELGNDPSHDYEACKRTNNSRNNHLSNHLLRIRESYSFAEARRLGNPQNAELERKRGLLPAAEHRADVISTIKREQIVLISGETGCGKSTQIPQFLLEDPSIGPVSRIVITQPRRISAISLAERIAFERGESVGDIIGYNIRMDNKLSSRTQVLFVTPGVLLRKLLDDPDLLEFSHVIVDEAHERDRFTEFLLIVLRDIAQRRSSLKLILMSATMHTNKLCAYFGDIPQINVGGSVFPVQEFFLEHVLKFIHYTPRSLAAMTASNLSAPLALTESASYFCSVCHKGPYISAEELGTHCALCFPSDTDGFINSFLSHRHLSLPTRAKAQKLEALLRRLAWIRSSVKASPTANNSAIVGSNLSKSAATVRAAEMDDDQRNGYNDIYEEDSEFDEDEDDDIAAKTDLYRASTARDTHDGGIGEKYLHSDESSELNQLLKMYQRDLEDSESITNPSDPNQMFIVGNSGNAGNNDIDYALIIALLRYIVSSEFGRDQGSILIFLPGWDDISRLHRLLMACDDFSQPSFLLLQLHSGVPRKEQQLVFQPVSQPGQRKIILSTNIAETSVTIDEVSVVIDSMLVKEKAYDAHTKLSYLKSTYISQASARQRKGRAGRTRAGVCFRLCSVLRARHLKEYQDSELLRMPLEELVLQAKALRLADGDQGALQFLSKALDPPSELAIKQAVHLLQSLQCLTKSSNNMEGENLTALGEVIAQLPMSPRQGKMLLLGCLFGVSTTTVQLAAIISGRDPFLLPASDLQRAKVNKEKMSFCGTSMCDQYAVCKALEMYMHLATRHGRSEAHRWCSSHELSSPSCQLLIDSAQQLDKSVRELTLPTASSISATVGIPTNHHRSVRNVGSIALTTLTLAMGLYPDFAVRVTGNDAQTSSSLFVTERGAKARIHPASVNSKIPKMAAANTSDESMKIDILCFQDLVALNAFSKNYRIGGPEYLMLQTTPVSVLGLCVLCGSLTEEPVEETTAGEQTDFVTLVVDDWMKLIVPRSDAQLILAVRLLIQQSLMLLIQRPESLLLTNNNAATKSNNNGVIITSALDRALQALEVSQQQILKPYRQQPPKMN